MVISGHTTHQAVIATMTVGTVLGVFVVAVRLFTRIVIVRKARWDDAIICAGCVSFSTPVCSVQLLTLLRFSVSHILSPLEKDVSARRSVRTGTLLTSSTVEFGMGQHYWNLSDETKTNGFYWFWVSIWITTQDCFV
jgi:hypothetical protein